MNRCLLTDATRSLLSSQRKNHLFRWFFILIQYSGGILIRSTNKIYSNHRSNTTSNDYFLITRTNSQMPPKTRIAGVKYFPMSVPNRKPEPIRAVIPPGIKAQLFS